jgi:beta-phosphoglucomutase-like phosphatase (HAD superfamily)
MPGNQKSLITKCVLFDMDGTLIDTTPLVEKHWRDYALEHGLDAEKVCVVLPVGLSCQTSLLISKHIRLDLGNVARSTHH